jgi:internalin A
MQQFLLIFTVVLLVGGLVLRRLLKARTMWVSNPSDQQNVLIEKEIRNQLSKPAGELTKSDLARVDYLGFSGAYLTDTGLKELAKVRNLKDLGLWCCPIIDADLKEVVKLKHLEKLNLGGTKITGSGLKEVAKFAKLTYLNLRYLPIADADLSELAKLKNLTHLVLNDTQITDEGLKKIVNLGKLSFLQLIDDPEHGYVPQITDAGLKELAKLKHLTELYLYGARVTQEGLAQLQQALPNCIIDTEKME